MSDRIDLTFNDRTRRVVNEDLARQACRSGSSTAFVDSCLIRNCQLEFVHDNSSTLKAHGMYERCLLYAYTAASVNFHTWDVGVLQEMFLTADRERLRAAGTPLPAKRKIRLYRGIAGRGRSRHPDGVAWTRSLGVACIYALNCSPEHEKLENPLVLTAEVKTDDILACEDRYFEKQVFWVPGNFEQLPLTPAQIQKHATRNRRNATLSEIIRFERFRSHLPAATAPQSP